MVDGNGSPASSGRQPEEDSSEEEHEDQQPSSSSSGTETSGSSSSGSKKKKKKKNKKKKGGGGPDGGGEPTASAPPPSQQQPSKAERAAAEKRFLDALKASGDDPWLDLSGCMLQDTKLEKLLERLKGNRSLTSLNLSRNQLADAGAEAIQVLLDEHSALPELISLDLRDNAFSLSALTKLEELNKRRSQLDIKTGSMDQLLLDDQPPKSKSIKELAKGPMFQKFFQTGDEQDEDAGRDKELDEAAPALEAGEQPTVPDISPEELWARIHTLLQGGQSSIPQLATALQELVAILQHQFSASSADGRPQSAQSITDHTRGCLDHLRALAAIMALCPPDVAVTYSKQRQPAVGSHRVWAAAVVAVLLARGNRAIDGHIARSQLVPQVLRLALDRPLCSALHSRALHVLQACTASREDALLAPLLTHVKEPEHNLLELLASLGTAALDVEGGKRHGLVGFVVAASRILQEVHNKASIKRALAGSAAWRAFVKPKTGPFHKLCAQQDAELGGPRPPPSLNLGGQDFSGLGIGGGDNMLSGQQLLALIQSMSMRGAGGPG